jgi:hypothetical protein
VTIRAQQPQRDPSREARFLLAAARRADSGDAFVAHATRRLQAGEEKFGSRWTELTLLEYVRELAEEGADLGAWSVLAAQVAEHVRSDRLPEVLDHLSLIAHAGAIAHAACENLARLINPTPTLDAAT